MTTIRRRQIKPGALSKSARLMLACASQEGLTAEALVRESGITPRLAWGGLAALLERGLIIQQGGQIVITRDGLRVLGRRPSTRHQTRAA